MLSCFWILGLDTVTGFGLKVLLCFEQAGLVLFDLQFGLTVWFYRFLGKLGCGFTVWFYRFGQVWLSFHSLV